MSGPGLVHSLERGLDEARERTLRLTRDLSSDELALQYHPEFSPIGWHLGHVAWQEECWALRRLGGEPPLAPELDALFDSFESNKSERGPLLPGARELFQYGERVRARTRRLLEQVDVNASDELAKDGYVFRFLANHERQHGEIIGMVRLLGRLPLPDASPGQPAKPASGPDWLAVPGGPFVLGSEADPDAWDNERAAHEVELDDFCIARCPVSAGDWLEMMNAGGYDDDRLWSAEGMVWKAREQVRAPLHWEQASDGSWQRYTLRGPEPVDPHKPVAHVSWYEANAFAQFAGARLPSEAEWERAASFDGVRKRRWPWGDQLPARANLDLAAPDVSVPGSFPAAPSGALDMVGSTWEWTHSVFAPYPQFSPQAYRGYSQPWFDGQHRVARGGSFLTSPAIARTTFRNFYLPHIRAAVLGLRLAR